LFIGFYWMALADIRKIAFDARSLVEDCNNHHPAILNVQNGYEKPLEQNSPQRGPKLFVQSKKKTPSF
jgi:hypothetical protein